jgi:hypothetical protein
VDIEQLIVRMARDNLRYVKWMNMWRKTGAIAATPCDKAVLDSAGDELLHICFPCS